MVFCIEVMSSLFQVRPKSARLTWTSASSPIWPGPRTETEAGNEEFLQRRCQLS
jgi:hypothetical protein